jgi:hypothetical protein
MQVGTRWEPLYIEYIVIGRLAAFSGFVGNMSMPFTSPAEPGVHFLPSALSPETWAKLIRADILCHLMKLEDRDRLSFVSSLTYSPPEPAPIGFDSATPPRQPRPHQHAQLQQQSPSPNPRAPRDTPTVSVTRQRPCIPDLLHQYGLSTATCPHGPACTAVHHTNVKGWPFVKAKLLIEAAHLGPSIEAPLLRQMQLDKDKFTDKDGTPAPRRHARPPAHTQRK